MSKERQKGTSFETSLLPLLKEYYPEASRAPLRGTKDEGDFILPGAPFIIEAKNHNRLDLAGWIGEAQREAVNAMKAAGIVVHKRRGNAKPGEQYVTLLLGDFLWLVNGGKGHRG